MLRRTRCETRRGGERWSVVVIAAVVIVLATDRFPCLWWREQRRLLRRAARRRHQVAVVLDDPGPGEAPLEHGRREVIAAAEVVEANDIVDRLAVARDAQRRQDDDAQPLDEELALLGVDLDEARLDVLLRQPREVHVDDLAARRALAVEVADDRPALFVRVEERPLVGELRVVAVAGGEAVAPQRRLVAEGRLAPPPHRLEVVLAEVVEASDLGVDTTLRLRRRRQQLVLHQRCRVQRHLQGMPRTSTRSSFETSV